MEITLAVTAITIALISLVAGIMERAKRKGMDSRVAVVEYAYGQFSSATTEREILKAQMSKHEEQIMAMWKQLDLIDPVELERREHAMRLSVEYRNHGLIVPGLDEMSQERLAEMERTLLVWKVAGVRRETSSEIDTDLAHMASGDDDTSVDLYVTSQLPITPINGDKPYPIPPHPHDETTPWSV